jgi:hypothetical protein
LRAIAVKSPYEWPASKWNESRILLFEDGYVGLGLLGKGRAVVQDLLVEELP